MTGTGQAPQSPEKVISFEQWVERYSPVFDDAEQSSLVQYPTWTALPNGIDLRTVWAVIESGDDEDTWAIFPGYHLVNVVYFTLTRQPWSEQDDVDYVEWGD